MGGRDRGNSELWYFQIHKGIIRFTKGTLISNSALSFKLKQKLELSLNVINTPAILL